MELTGITGGSVVKNPLASSGDMDLIPGSRRTEEGNSNPFQYSCLANPTDRGAWWAIIQTIDNFLFSDKKF